MFGPKPKKRWGFASSRTSDRGRGTASLDRPRWNDGDTDAEQGVARILARAWGDAPPHVREAVRLLLRGEVEMASQSTNDPGALPAA